jgi:hypothetical protein
MGRKPAICSSRGTSTCLNSGGRMRDTAIAHRKYEYSRRLHATPVDLSPFFLNTARVSGPPTESERDYYCLKPLANQSKQQHADRCIPPAFFSPRIKPVHMLSAVLRPALARLLYRQTTFLWFVNRNNL